MNTKVLGGFFAGGAVVGVLMFFIMRPAAPRAEAPRVVAAEAASPAPEAPVPAPVAVAPPAAAPEVAKPRIEKAAAPRRVVAAKPEAAPAAKVETVAAKPAATPEDAAPKPAEPEYKSNPALDHARAQRVPPPPDENHAETAAAAPTAPPPAPRKPNSVTLKDGTLLNVRLSERLSSERQNSGDTFWATLDEPLVADGFVIAERGSRIEGKVVNSVRAGRVKGTAELSLQLTRLRTSDGQNVDIKTVTFTKEGPKSVKEDAVKVGVGSAIGAAIGAIAGGGRGAAIGAATGGAAGGGYVLTTRGKPAELPVETRLSFRLEVPVTLTEKLK